MFSEMMKMEKPINYSYYYQLDLCKLKTVKDSVFNYLSEFDTLYLDCGRACIKALSAEIGSHGILLPDYTCSSVIQGFNSCKNIFFYHINDDFTINFATVYKGNIIKNLIMDCQSYTKYRPNETTGGIFVSWRRKEELPTGLD